MSESALPERSLYVKASRATSGRINSKKLKSDKLSAPWNVMFPSDESRSAPFLRLGNLFQAMPTLDLVWTKELKVRFRLHIRPIALGIASRNRENEFADRILENVPLRVQSAPRRAAPRRAVCESPLHENDLAISVGALNSNSNLRNVEQCHGIALTRKSESSSSQ